jgi:hypothetical protein
MLPSRKYSVISWALALVIASCLIALVIFHPVIAGIGFVILLLVIFLGTRKRDGTLRAVIVFLKNILFGW